VHGVLAMLPGFDRNAPRPQADCWRHPLAQRGLVSVQRAVAANHAGFGKHRLVTRPESVMRAAAAAVVLRQRIRVVT
jgi:hypothetical protein